MIIEAKSFGLWHKKIPAGYRNGRDDKQYGADEFYSTSRWDDLTTIPILVCALLSFGSKKAQSCVFIEDFILKKRG